MHLLEVVTAKSTLKFCATSNVFKLCSGVPVVYWPAAEVVAANDVHVSDSTMVWYLPAARGALI